jgi:hypothetical protein
MPLWRKTLSEDRMTSSIKHLGIVTELRRAPTAGKIRLRAIGEATRQREEENVRKDGTYGVIVADDIILLTIEDECGFDKR